MSLDPHRNGVGYKACCPGHDDDNPSLVVSEGDDGKVLFNCKAGCDFPKIVSAMGMTEKDMFPVDPTSNGDLRQEGEGQEGRWLGDF